MGKNSYVKNEKPSEKFWGVGRVGARVENGRGPEPWPTYTL